MMKNNSKSTGVIFLTTPAAASLFEHEIKGQMSDGAWENSMPHDHWKFWSDLDVKLGDVNVVHCANPWNCMKTGYNLAGLIEHIGDRMKNIGAMAKAKGDVLSDLQGSAAGDMPATFDEFKQCKASNKWEYDFLAKYMEDVSLELAEKFYAQKYSEKDLRADLKLVKIALKSVEKNR